LVSVMSLELTMGLRCPSVEHFGRYDGGARETKAFTLRRINSSTQTYKENLIMTFWGFDG
jgi:hypothetical protein